ncbi:acyltransferase domain-containing protein [Streptomyces sp. PmtA]|uniref:acyltransferase domain-containing protein n=1 Tax=Streptomyces sp. PmtA TaxID=3074275 RepID=UPI0030156C43
MLDAARDPAGERAVLPVASPVLLLPGQGAQYPGMGTGLYRAEPGFAAAVDEVFAAMGPAGSVLRADWLAERPAMPMDDVTRSQPLLFALDHALGRVLLDRGLRPGMLLGHSIGEVAAATLAGVFRLQDAVRLVLDRVDHLTSAPPGGMLAVAASRAELAGKLRPGVDVGAVNAPRQTVLAGPAEPLAATAKALRAAGFTCAPVPSLTPFHSAALESAVHTGHRSLAGVPLRPPAIPVVSGYTADPPRRDHGHRPGLLGAAPGGPRAVLARPGVGAGLGGAPAGRVRPRPGAGHAGPPPPGGPVRRRPGARPAGAPHGGPRRRGGPIPRGLRPVGLLDRPTRAPSRRTSLPSFSMRRDRHAEPSRSAVREPAGPRGGSRARGADPGP